MKKWFGVYGAPGFMLTQCRFTIVWLIQCMCEKHQGVSYFGELKVDLHNSELSQL